MTDPPDSIAVLIGRHRRIALDSNVLIYLTEGDARRAEAVARIVDEIGAGRSAGSLSSLGLAEVLVGPARADDGAGFERLAATLRDLGLRIMALDAPTAEDAAWIRGRSSLALVDAVHLASAIAAGATAFITNDRRIGPQRAIEVIYLDDLVGIEPAA